MVQSTCRLELLLRSFSFHTKPLNWRAAVARVLLQKPHSFTKMSPSHPRSYLGHRGKLALFYLFCSLTGESVRFSYGSFTCSADDTQKFCERAECLRARAPPLSCVSLAISRGHGFVKLPLRQVEQVSAERPREVGWFTSALRSGGDPMRPLRNTGSDLNSSLQSLPI